MHRRFFDGHLLDADLGAHPLASGLFDESPHQVRERDRHDDETDDADTATQQHLLRQAGAPAGGNIQRIVDDSKRQQQRAVVDQR
ncbi:MAG TPA: hypothetical protein DCQ04_06770 [Actinobacteria bacterium]|nr:hypothetical protein [Actinomycetota bacterium]